MKIAAINIDTEIMGGTPVFNGTRVPVESLFQWLETETLEEFLENFPSVKRAGFAGFGICRKTNNIGKNSG
ncbi:MAG: DUF433 domain-containing protein [Segetibacter sp.]